MHRNTYLNSPRLLDRYYRLTRRARCIRFAGQITGVEGYVESTASGFLCGGGAGPRGCRASPVSDFPRETAIGALALLRQRRPASGNFQPMNVNFGILAPLGYRVKGKANKNLAIAQRALETLDALLETGI